MTIDHSTVLSQKGDLKEDDKKSWGIDVGSWVKEICKNGPHKGLIICILDK